MIVASKQAERCSKNANKDCEERNYTKVSGLLLLKAAAKEGSAVNRLRNVEGRYWRPFKQVPDLQAINGTCRDNGFGAYVASTGRRPESAQKG